MILEIARLAGRSGAFLILIQLLLIAWGRKTNLHKLNGKVAFFLIIVHVVSMLYINGLSVLRVDEIFKAFISFLLLVLVILTSIFIRNKLKYETWHNIHLLTYIAILLAFGHQNPPFPIFWKSLYIFTFANVFYFKFLKLILIFLRYRFYVEKIVQETASTVSIYISGNDIEKFTFEPGQYVIIRFLDKNLFWQAHPFSFSEIPGRKSLRLTIKNSGDFTKLLNTRYLALNTRVVLDGPYGDFTAQKSNNDKILLLAGGVGVTPLRTLIETFTKLKKDVLMVYTARNKAEVLFEKELTKYNVKYIFGRLEKDVLQNLVPNIASREVYICGPQSFNKSMKQYSQEFGVKSIHLEEFST